MAFLYCNDQVETGASFKNVYSICSFLDDFDGGNVSQKRLNMLSSRPFFDIKVCENFNDGVLNNNIFIIIKVEQSHR